MYKRAVVQHCRRTNVVVPFASQSLRFHMCMYISNRRRHLDTWATPSSRSLPGPLLCVSMLAGAAFCRRCDRYCPPTRRAFAAAGLSGAAWCTPFGPPIFRHGASQYHVVHDHSCMPLKPRLDHPPPPPFEFLHGEGRSRSARHSQQPRQRVAVLKS